jgi:hypothetical protein
LSTSSIYFALAAVYRLIIDPSLKKSMSKKQGKKQGKKQKTVLYWFSDEKSPLCPPP